MNVSRKRILTLVVVALIGVLTFTGLFTSPARAQTGSTGGGKTVMYFFWGDGCPHCASFKPILEELVKKYPGFELQEYEVWYDDNNLNFLQAVAKKFGIEVSGVPTLFIGDQTHTGFSEQLAAEVEQTIAACVANGCADAAEGVARPDVTAKTFYEEPGSPLTVVPPANPAEFAEKGTITVPIFGTVDLKHQSLFISTLLISFVDGVNPCSVWVLTMLITLTLRTGSRKKIFIIGLIFLTVTAAIYGLFIAGLFSVLTIVRYAGWIQAVVALVALFFGIVNIKDYFWYKEGLSFTIDDSKKPGIFQRMRRVLDASDSFWGLAGATVVLAAGVSLVEFSCTAGFPVLWTNLLNGAGVTTAAFIGLLLVYMLIYQLDEMIIFGSAVLTLKASRLEEKHGRILKLIGGTLMLTLAVVMLIKPSLMNEVGKSLLVFAIAFAAAGFILLLHRRILPSYGIWIGTEKNSHPRSKKKKTKGK